MRIVQSVAGVFHHFDIARELHQRGALTHIYSTFPWARLKREGLPHSFVSSPPLCQAVHTALMKNGRFGVRIPAGIERDLSYWNGVALDRYVASHAPPCEVLFAISGCGRAAGAKLRQQGAVYVCDRGSSHVRFQAEILREEHQRFGVTDFYFDPRVIVRDEAEYAEADAITVPSRFARETFLAQGVAPEKVHRLPYGVRLDKFFPDGEPDSDAFTLLFAGGVNFRKGVPYLLEAFRSFQHPRKLLRIAGAVDDAMRAWLARVALPDGVQVLGPVSQPELRKLMSTSDVMVLPSIEEGLALVQGQALACGCPVIATENTGGADLFSDGVEGFLVPIRSLEAILERLDLLADSPNLRASMRAAALARVRKLGGWSDYTDQFMALMSRLVEERSVR